MKRSLFLALLIFSIIVTTWTPLGGKYRELQNGVRSVTDSAWVFLTSIVPDTACVQRAQVLESSKRNLEKRLSEEQFMSSGFLATASAHLSRLSGEWIVLHEAGQKIETGDLVLSDGIFFGSIDRVFPSYATVLVPTHMTHPGPVMHAKTRTLGLLSAQSGVLTVTFMKRVEGIAVGDSLRSVPDGIHTTDSYPLGEIIADETSQESSVTVARVRTIAAPRILDAVTIFGRRQ